MIALERPIFFQEPRFRIIAVMCFGWVEECEALKLNVHFFDDDRIRVPIPDLKNDRQGWRPRSAKSRSLNEENGGLPSAIVLVSEIQRRGRHDQAHSRQG